MSLPASGCFCSPSETSSFSPGSQAEMSGRDQRFCYHRPTQQAQLAFFKLKSLQMVRENAGSIKNWEITAFS